MRAIIKALSLAVLPVMCLACTEKDMSSHQSSDHSHSTVSEHSSEDKNQSKKITAVPVVSDKAEVTETRSADSHNHGDAALAIVLDGSMVTLELDTPLHNLLGFEHAAETAAQKAAVVKAKSVLSNANPLFIFNKEAGCVPSADRISVELDVEGHAEADEHDDHDEHQDEDGHDETHKDVILQYEYECRSPKSLKNVTINLFKHFENLTELDLVYLGPNTQKQAELSPTKTRMNLTR